MGDFFHETTTFNIYDLDGNLIDIITEIKDFDGEVENIFPKVDCINERCKKENNEMITAEEARNIADENNTTIKDIFSSINRNIISSAENGEYKYSEYYHEGSNCHRYQKIIEKKLKNIGYDVNIRRTVKSTDINLEKLYDYCICISWFDDETFYELEKEPMIYINF